MAHAPNLIGLDKPAPLTWDDPVALRRTRSESGFPLLTGIAKGPIAHADGLQHHIGSGLITRPGRVLVQDTTMRLPLAPQPKAPQPSRWARLRRAVMGPEVLRAADSMGDILRAGIIDADTTVVFDLDRTLIRPRNGHYPRSKALWPKVTEPVEENTAQLVARLQQCGLPVMGLTARGIGERWENAKCTQKQLRRIGVDLSLTSPLPDRADYGLRGAAATRHGVTFCGSNSKGRVFERIWEAMPHTSRVVMIDDGLHNFPSLLNATRRMGVDMVCVYYRNDLSPAERLFEHRDWLRLKYLG